MHPNPVLKKLGLAGEDRLVLIHADDVGASQASLAAYVDLKDYIRDSGIQLVGWRVLRDLMRSELSGAL